MVRSLRSRYFIRSQLNAGVSERRLDHFMDQFTDVLLLVLGWLLGTLSPSIVSAIERRKQR